MPYREETKAIRNGELFAKALSGTLTANEQVEFDAWLADPDHRALFESSRKEYTLKNELSSFDRYNEQTAYPKFLHFRDIERKVRRRSFAKWLPYAAAVVFVLAVGAFFLSHKQQFLDTESANVEIPPGGNRAQLTLANGRTIDLNEAQTGIVVGDAITYADGTAVTGERATDGAENQRHGTGEGTPLVLSTPKGGTYQITLSDGTKVWLNAASTLTYPSQFGDKERVVEVRGEAYFSVSPDVSRPFKVMSGRQEIEVLGTEFNLSAYVDDPEIRTTLVEGKVKVANLVSQVSNLLLPGKQAVTHGSVLEINEVDIFDYTAWKDGIIVLNGAHLPEVIRQLERWYNISIDLPERETTKTAYVMINRNENLSSVLKALEETYDVKLKQEGRRIRMID